MTIPLFALRTSVGGGVAGALALQSPMTFIPEDSVIKSRNRV
jgi:hypothetical protein